MNPFRTTPLPARRAVLALLTIGVLPAAVSAQSLPPAREVVDRYIEAIGGREAVLAPKSTHSTGQFSMPAMGITGELEVYSAQPDRSITRVDIAGVGEIRTGYDGEVGWSLNPMEGPRIMEGMELAGLRDQASNESTLRSPELVESMETVEKTTMNGQECYRVKVVWKSGRESHDCYAVDSGLLVGMEMRNESPMGTIDVTVLLSEYKQFGSLTMPTRMTQQMMGQEQVMTITSVEFGTVDDSVFELPAEIKALVNR